MTVQSIAKIFAISLPFLLTAAGSFAAEDFQPYNDGIGRVAWLSDETSRVFERGGHGLSLLERAWYASALITFPSVRDCLVPEQRGRRQPSLSQLDWAAMGSISSFEVCLFRIADSYSSISDVERWFQAIGLEMDRWNASHRDLIIGPVGVTTKVRPRASGDVADLFNDPKSWSINVAFVGSTLKGVKTSRLTK